MLNLIGKVNNILRNIVVFSLVVLMASAGVVAGEVFLAYGSADYKYEISSLPHWRPIPSHLTDPAYNDSMMLSGQAAFGVGEGECGAMDYNTQGLKWSHIYFRKWIDLPADTFNVQVTVVGPGLDVLESNPFDPGIRQIYVNNISIKEGTIGYEGLGACYNIQGYTIDVPDDAINEGANLITIWIYTLDQPWRFDMRMSGEVSETPTIDELMANVTGLDLPEGIKSSLLSKLDAAFTSLEDGKTKTAVNHLNAFKNRVEAQRGKKISEEDAETLLASAGAIITDIEIESGG